jgi:two-component system sensor histidine kinase FlrB
MLPSTDLAIPAMPPVVAASETREQLQDAFAKFSETAISLERSYLLLREEVTRLRDELRRKQGELDAERERVRQAKALGEYSALLAHEVRNPLASMELFTELLLECGDLEQDARGWVEQLQAGLRTLAMLTNNVLRIHETTGTGAMSTLQVGNVLASTVQFLAPVANQNSVQLAYEDRSEGATVAADLSRLQQLFLNLTLNALHVSQPGGQVNFSVEQIEGADRLEKCVRVMVQDFGRGISPEHRARIFEPGFTTRPGSVGLGLAVCKKIVDQHGGRILVDTVVGRGSKFIVELPAL